MAQTVEVVSPIFLQLKENGLEAQLHIMTYLK